MTPRVRVGQVYEERGYNRHFKIRAIDGNRAVVSSCQRDGSEFQSGLGQRTRIRLDRLVKSPYVLKVDSGVQTCPTCSGTGTVELGA